MTQIGSIGKAEPDRGCTAKYSAHKQSAATGVSYWLWVHRRHLLILSLRERRFIDSISQDLAGNRWHNPECSAEKNVMRDYLQKGRRMKRSSVGRWGPGNNKCRKQSPPLGLAGWWWRDRVNRRQGALGQGGGCGHPWDGLVPSISCWCLPLAENSGIPGTEGPRWGCPVDAPNHTAEEGRRRRGGRRRWGASASHPLISSWPRPLLFLAHPLVSSWPRPLIFWSAHSSHPGPAHSRLAPPTPGLLAASLTQPKTRTYLSGPNIKGSITIACVSSVEDRPAGFIQQSLPA